MKNKPTSKSSLPKGYATWFNDLKSTVLHAQTDAISSVNQRLVLLYWEIGKAISEKRTQKSWGSSIIDHLATDLRKAFPRMRGFSRRNLFYMVKFHELMGDFELVQKSALIPWSYLVLLVTEVKSQEEMLFYIHATVEYGWSRNILALQIERHLFKRQGRAITNFKAILPSPQSELAHQTLKDPYIFDFVTLTDESVERDLENQLIEHIKKFLLELGVGFAFVGNQVHLEVGDQDYYIDLLFYHIKLRCYVVIDLKMTEFKPEFAGKMNFYLSAVDAKLKHADDSPSIGIVLCRKKNNIIAEYALKDSKKAIGISSFKLTQILPENLRSSLPTI